MVLIIKLFFSTQKRRRKKKTTKDGTHDNIRGYNKNLFVLDQHSELDIYSALQSAGRPVASIAHIILITRNPVFALTISAVCVTEHEYTRI